MMNMYQITDHHIDNWTELCDQPSSIDACIVLLFHQTHNKICYSEASKYI